MNKYHPRSWNIPGNPGDVCGLSVGWNKQNDNKFNKLLTKHVHSARTHAHTHSRNGIIIKKNCLSIYL